MMKRTYYLSLVLCVFAATAFSQEKNEASTPHEKPLSADSLITTDGRLDSLYRALPEVMITGQRPLVKTEQGKLIYDLPRLIANLPVDNAYDAVKELPGVTEMNGALSLAGQGVTIVIDGKVTTLSVEQLYALLKSIPAGRIERAEVMYNASARYQVRGALINLTLKHNENEQPSVQGELHTAYRQQYYENLNERASLLYSNGKFSADLLYSYAYGHNRFLTDKEALHTLGNASQQTMNMSEVSSYRSNHHTVRLGADYRFDKKHQLSVVYNGTLSNSHNMGTAKGTQNSQTYTRSTDNLHNGRIDCSTPFGLKAGAEFTYYSSPAHQSLHSILNDVSLSFNSSNSQKINHWKAFLAQEHSLKKGWDMNYGAIYTSTLDNSFQFHSPSENGNPTHELPGDMRSRQREHTLNLYTGFSKSFGNKLSLEVSLAAEQYKNQVWNRWDFYPTFHLNYTPAPGHIWQFALSSDKSYPEYWAMQDAIFYLGGEYSEIHGNPLLKPQQSYGVSTIYILKGRYIFKTWFNHNKDYSVQTLYQSPQRLVEIYKYLNFDYQQQAGVQASVPFKMKKWLNSRLTLIGVWHHEKDSDFWDIPFNRRICYGMAVMNNTFSLSTKPNLKLTVTGMIRSKAFQGIYDLPTSGHLNIALRYAFAKEKAVLNLFCNDLFETNQISPRIRFMSQNVTNRYSSFREFGVSLTYKFGEYQEKPRVKVDRSRFK